MSKTNDNNPAKDLQKQENVNFKAQKITTTINSF